MRDLRGRFAYHLPILGYHRIGAATGDHVPTVSAAMFKQHLAWLARGRFQVLSVEDVVQRLERGEPLPRRSAAITFDDGYEDTYTIAWPLLRQRRFPATVFITPGEVGLRGFASWEQVRQMAEEGMTIGSHTMRHSYVPLVPSDRLAEELVESKRVIETKIQRPVHFLSYPVGGFTPDAQAVAARAGYRAAFTTNRGVSFSSIDRYALRRIKMTNGDAHSLLFRIKLSGYYDAFRQLKHPA